MNANGIRRCFVSIERNLSTIAMAWLARQARPNPGHPPAAVDAAVNPPPRPLDQNPPVAPDAPPNQSGLQVPPPV